MNPSNPLASLPPELANALPDEIAQYIELQKQKKYDRIEQLGVAIDKKRHEAITGRSGSGIEQEWVEDIEAYQGIDDANRAEGKTYKPLSHTGASIIPKRDPTRSTVFLNITRPYTDAASARVSDMLLPTDDRNWAIKPTPIPSGLQVSPQAPVPPTGAVPPGAMPAAPNPVADQIQMIMDAAEEKAKKAEKRIEDWLVESQWHSEVRKVIEDCSMIGTGILKGPYPIKRKRKKVEQRPEGMALTMEIEIAPASRRIDPWDFYPDPNCGENIQDGQYVLEHDRITVRKLRDLKGLPGYINEAIDKVIEEGPGKRYKEGVNPLQNDTLSDADIFDIWYFYGVIEKEDLEAMGVEHDSKMDSIPAIVTLVNDTPIKAALNPLDSGEFPYDVMPWQRRAGQCWGMGIARQIRTPQRMINAATRNMMDNAGLSGGPQIVVRKNVIEPADKSWVITPRKIWYAREDADVRTVADALTAINIPSMQGDLMAIIQFALKMAEDVTGLPMIMQGQLGKSPDTVGGMEMLQNNASTVLRRIARTFDDCLTEPHIRRYYDWLMEYGEEEEKGDYVIDARGSSAMVERSLQNQFLLQLGAFVVNPSYEISPSRYMDELLKSQKIDPKRVKLNDQEKQAMAQQPPPPMPQVEVAKIRAEADLKKTQMVTQAQMYRTKVDTDRDAVYVQAQAQRDRADAMYRVEELKIKREIAYLQAQIQKGIEVDANKVKLADTAMKLRVQKELAAGARMTDLHKHHNPQVATPATEPPGRAKPGEAFQA